MTQQYTQCKLERGNVSQTVWIPTEYAVVGKYIQIKDLDIEKDTIQWRGKTLNRLDTWENGWLVKEIYLTEDEDRVINKHNDSWGGMPFCY